MNASDIRAALRLAYTAPEWAILFEVLDATGARHTRSADAVAMSLWPSRGLSVWGFEIKVYRGDWLREKANPEKAEAIAKYCDFWHVVAPKGLIKIDELPDAWGLKEVDEKGALRTAKEAQKLDSKPLDRLFVASLLRNAGKVDDAEVGRLVEQQLEERVEREVKARENWRERSKERYAKLDEVLQRAQKDGDWIADDEVIAAVMVLAKSGIARSYGGLIELEKQLRQSADRIGTLMGLMSFPTDKKRKRA